MGIDKEIWEEAAESELLYRKRALGEVKDPKEIILQILTKLNIQVSEKDVNKIVDKRVRRFERALLNVDKEILDTLRVLRKLSKRVCLISNADIIDKKAWGTSPLEPYFNKAIFSCDVGLVKPNKEIYELALKEMKTNPEKSLFIGDGGADELKGAKESGITTVLITHYLEEYSKDRVKYADIIIKEISELRTILR